MSPRPSESEREDALSPPISTFAIVILWSVIELCAIIAIDRDGNFSRSGIQPAVALSYGGLCAGALLGATWWVLGARRIASHETKSLGQPRSIRIDRLFRGAVLMIALANVIGFAKVTGLSVVMGHTMVAGTIAMLLPIVYRQITGRRIAKHGPQMQCAFDIRGLMTVTLAVAIAGGIASSTGVFRSTTFLLAVMFGVSLGALWFSLIGVLMKRPIFWLVFSLILFAVHIAVSVSIGMLGPQGDDDASTALILLSVSLYLHGIMYFLILRTADYRLAYR